MQLVDLVPSLKRAVAPPGEYDALFPNSVDSEVRDLLADAVAECQFDGFLSTATLDVDAATVTPDLTSGQQALVILYAMARHLSSRLSNLKTHTRFKAGTVEAETDQAASVLVELLKAANSRKKQALDDAKAGNLAAAFLMVDQYVAKSIDASTPDLAYLRPPYDIPGRF
jgi:hypothetical protein